VSSVVLDASALIAFLRKEPGEERVRPVLGRALLSAVNLSETIAKLVEYGAPLAEVTHQIARLQLTTCPFGETEASLCASLRLPTRDRGLSLGDRACLALGVQRNLPVYTTESIWAEVDLGVEVVLIRSPRGSR
jgi:ribonuclease VapC